MSRHDTEAVLTIPDNIYAFVLGSCRGDSSDEVQRWADAVIECMFYEDRTIPIIATVYGLNTRTLRRRVNTCRARLSAHRESLVGAVGAERAKKCPQGANP